MGVDDRLVEGAFHGLAKLNTVTRREDALGSGLGPDSGVGRLGSVDPAVGQVNEALGNAAQEQASPTDPSVDDTETGGSVEVSFTAAAGADSYVAVVFDADSKFLKVVPGADSPIEVDGLTDDEEYQFTVVAVSDTGRISNPTAAESGTPTTGE